MEGTQPTQNRLAELTSNPLFWAALGSIGVSLLFRVPMGRSVRRVASRWVVPMVFMGLYQRMRMPRP